MSATAVFNYFVTDELYIMAIHVIKTSTKSIINNNILPYMYIEAIGAESVRTSPWLQNGGR